MTQIGVEHDVRPWGSYTVVDEGPHHKVKRIVVTPGLRLPRFSTVSTSCDDDVVRIADDYVRL